MQSATQAARYLPGCCCKPHPFVFVLGRHSHPALDSSIRPHSWASLTINTAPLCVCRWCLSTPTSCSMCAPEAPPPPCPPCQPAAATTGATAAPPLPALARDAPHAPAGLPLASPCSISSTVSVLPTLGLTRLHPTTVLSHPLYVSPVRCCCTAVCIMPSADILSFGTLPACLLPAPHHPTAHVSFEHAQKSATAPFARCWESHTVGGPALMALLSGASRLVRSLSSHFAFPASLCPSTAFHRELCTHFPGRHFILCLLLSLPSGMGFAPLSQRYFF